MRIPALALTLAAAAVVALPTGANADAPVAVDDKATTTTGVATSFNVLDNDTDVDEDVLSMTVTSEPANGSVDCLPNGDCTYTPDAGWSGIDTFKYSVSDNTEGTLADEGQVSVETVNVSSITIASTPTANLVWPAAITEATPVPAARFSGVVKKRTPTGTVIAGGVEVQLMEKPTGADGFIPVEGAVDVSNDLGKVSVPGIVPNTFTIYKWKAGNYLSGLTTLGVTPSLTTKFTPGTLAHTETVAVSGTSGPATGDESVELQRRNSSGAWVSTEMSTTLGTPDDNGYSTYSFTLPGEDSSRSIYRVVLAEAHGRNAVTSGQTTVNRYDGLVTDVHAADADESVTVRNNGAMAVNLQGWILKDANNKSVTLPKWTLAKGDTVVIHSGRGRNKGRHLYLRTTNRWANSGGIITLYDKREVPMDSKSYGTPQ